MALFPIVSRRLTLTSMTIIPGQSWSWMSNVDRYELVRMPMMWQLRIDYAGNFLPDAFDFVTIDQVLEFFREEAVQYPEEIAMTLENLLEDGF
jgi:hypothetical protein